MINRPAFTDAITDYIISKIPPYIGLAIVQLDENNKLINWMGPVNKYCESKLQKGIEIEAFAPFLTGMIPPMINRWCPRPRIRVRAGGSGCRPGYARRP